MVEDIHSYGYKPKTTTEINWNLVNAYKSIFSFYYKTQRLDLNLEQEYPEIPLNLIELIKGYIGEKIGNNYFDFELNDKQSSNIFDYLNKNVISKDYRLSYNNITKMFLKTIPISKSKIISIANELRIKELRMKEEIINSNIDNFIEVLENEVLQGSEYSIKVSGDNISIYDNKGDPKGNVYRLKDSSVYYLKPYSPALMGHLFKKARKIDTDREIFFPSDFINSSINVNLNKYVMGTRPEKQEENLKNIYTSIFNYDELTQIAQLEQLGNLHSDDRINIYMHEYTQIETILSKYYLELSNSAEKEIYRKINDDEFSKEDELILNSFEIELNKNRTNIDSFKKIKNKINEQNIPNIPQEKFNEYFDLILLLNVIQTLKQRTKTQEILNKLKSSKDFIVQNIVSSLFVKQNNKEFFDLTKLQDILKDIKIDKINNKKEKEYVEYLIMFQNDLDINKYLYFYSDQELTKLKKLIYSNIDFSIDFLHSFLNEKGKFSFKDIKNTKQIKNLDLFTNIFKEFISIETIVPIQKKDIVDTIEIKELKVLDFLEKESLEKNSQQKHEDNIVYISISRMLLFLQNIQNKSKDLTTFSKYFLNREKMKETYDLLKLYSENKKLNIKFPINLFELYNELDDNLRNIIKNYMYNNDIKFNKDNKLIQDISKEISFIKNLNQTPFISDYIELKKYYLDNYSKIDESIKKYIDKYSFTQFFLDFSSLKKYEIFDKFKKSLNEDSFLLKNNIDKLKEIETRLLEHKGRILNINHLLIELNIFKFIQFIDSFINDQKNISSLKKLFKEEETYDYFYDEVKRLLSNKNYFKAIENGLKNIKDEQLVFAKYSKIIFLNDDFKLLLGQIIKKEVNPTFNEFMFTDTLDIKYPSEIKQVNGLYKVKKFTDYFYDEIKEERNIVFKLRTRYTQLSFLTLRIAQDIVNDKYFDEKYEPYFESKEKLLEFKSLIENNILIKTKFGIEVHKNQTKLRNFLRTNHINIGDLIDSFHGYVPDGELANFFIKDMTNIADGKNYYLDALGITNKNKLAYMGLLTPEINIDTGFVIGYNLRVINKTELDFQKLENIFVSYLNGQQKKYINKYFNTYNVENLKKDLKRKSNQELEQILEKVNTILEKNQIFTLNYFSTPKELATKKNMDFDLKIKEDSSVSARTIGFFSPILKIKDMDFDKPIVLHISEGCKDGMSLLSTLSYSKNKNQIVLPLQGTQGFKYEFEDILFNLPKNQKVVLKLWADLDYAGLTLIHKLKEVTDKYPNVSFISMQELTFNDIYQEKINTEGFDKYKGTDFTDYSVLKATTLKIYKQNQIKDIDEFNQEFDYTSKTFRSIALESLKLEYEKNDGVNFKIDRFLQSVGLSKEDFDETELKFITEKEDKKVLENSNIK